MENFSDFFRTSGLDGQEFPKTPRVTHFQTTYIPLLFVFCSAKLSTKYKKKTVTFHVSRFADFWFVHVFNRCTNNTSLAMSCCFM